MFENLRRQARIQKLFDPSQFQGLPPEAAQAPMVEEPIFNPSAMGVGNLGNRQQPFQINFDPSQADLPPVDEDPYEHMALDRLNAMLKNFPNSEDTKPSMLRRIASMAIGIKNGPDAQQKFLHERTNRAMKEWGDEWSPTYQAATNERYNNANVKSLLALKETERKNAETAALNDRKQTEIERKNTVDEATRAARTAAYDYRSRNPNSILRSDKEGYIIAVQPQTNRVTYLTDSLGQKIKSDKLSDTDRINLQFDRREELAEVVGGEARKTKGTASGATKAETANQRKISEYLKAREALNTHPEWAEYITLGDPGTNDFTIAPPTPGNWFRKGTPEDIYKAINEAVYGAVADEKGPAITGSHKSTGVTPESLAGGEPRVQSSKVTPNQPASKLTQARKGVTLRDIPPPPGRVNVYKDGRLVATIPDTPEKRALAKAKGLTVK